MDNETVTSNISLIGLQNQLDTVRSEVFSTNSNLQTIGRLIQTDNFEDQKRLIEERNQEKLLAEKEIRSIDEEQLKQKVDAAVVKPIQKLEPKLKSSLSSITLGLGALFGVLSSPIIGSLKSAANLGVKTFTGIGDILKNSLGVIGSIFSSFSSGFSSVIGAIGKVTSKVLGALKDLAKSPFKAIADAFKKLLPGSSRTPTLSPTSQLSGGGLSSFMGFLGGAAKFAGSVGSGVNAVQSAKEDDAPGTALGALGIFNPFFALGSFGYEALDSPGKNLNISSMQNAFSSAVEYLKNSFSGSNLNFNMNNFSFDSIKDGFSTAFSSFPFFQSKSQSQSQSQPQSTSEPQALPTVSFQSLPPAPAPTPEPEVSPEIVYVDGGSNQQSPVLSTNSSTTTDVPLLSSSNPDNFYTLYSQVNYNVII